MRPLLSLLMALAACAPKGEKAAQSPAARYAGTWEGRSFRAPGDTGVAWTNVMTIGPDGRLTGSLTFTGTNLPAVPVTVLEVTDSSVVQEVGPYVSPTIGAEALTRAEGRVMGDSLIGTFEMRPTKGGAPVRGTFVAKRKTM